MMQSNLMTDLLQTKLQLRLVAFLLAGSILFTLLDPLLLLIGPSHSTIYLVAMSTSMRAAGVAALFGGLAVLVLPYMLLQCGLFRSRRREVVKAACLGLGGATLLWMLLAWRCTQLDLATSIAWIFARNGLGSLMVAGVLSFSLNAERVRSLLEDTQ